MFRSFNIYDSFVLAAECMEMNDAKTYEEYEGITVLAKHVSISLIQTYKVA